MEIGKALDNLARLEATMAETYEWMSRVFEADEEAAAFFIRMARDETSHANLVTFERRLVRADRDAFASNVDIPPTLIGDALERVHEFRRSNPSPTLVEALRFALKMEADCAENLHRDAVLQGNPSLGRLIGNLAKADQQHYEQLERFIAQRSDLFD